MNKVKEIDVEQFLKWTPELSVGIDVIDDQHKRIVHYINELHQAGLTQDREAVGRVLDQLVDYTLSHFSFEEAMMEEARYAFLPVHKKVHDLFGRRVDDYRQRFAQGEDVATAVKETLVKWLVEHIKRDDVDYAATVRANMGIDQLKPSAKAKSGWLDTTMTKFFGSK